MFYLAHDPFPWSVDQSASLSQILIYFYFNHLEFNIRTVLVCSVARLVMATTLLHHIALHLQGYCMVMGNVGGSLADRGYSCF